MWKNLGIGIITRTHRPASFFYPVFLPPARFLLFSLPFLPSCPPFLSAQSVLLLYYTHCVQCPHTDTDRALLDYIVCVCVFGCLLWVVSRRRRRTRTSLRSPEDCPSSLSLFSPLELPLLFGKLLNRDGFSPFFVSLPPCVTLSPDLYTSLSPLSPFSIEAAAAAPPPSSEAAAAGH